jgi:hypothetical protein
MREPQVFVTLDYPGESHLVDPLNSDRDRTGPIKN